ncbi:toll/interleukin-1 receptor domain-containing adapter protein isoform X2 [Ambystoma mexicanum]|uniref:toll/interleukin-1 receptor domain-containing adapter protein isoform X2 n=1 Tax=Ambystoma mexicanum TaxID=8296 RepID=UPI0037E7EA9A
MAGWWRRLLGKHEKTSSSSSSTQVASSLSNPASPCKPSNHHAVHMVNVWTVRQRKDYDACICHSEKDLTYALDLVSYLEGQTEAFRCFLQLRDSEAGGSIPTEICNALTNSHCWVLLITQDFIEDRWCNYQMQQAIAEAPMSNGRIIPFIKDLEHEQCPRELRFMYKVWASSVKDEGFHRIKTALLTYFEEARRAIAMSSAASSGPGLEKQREK